MHAGTVRRALGVGVDLGVASEAYGAAAGVLAWPAASGGDGAAGLDERRDVPGDAARCWTIATVKVMASAATITAAPRMRTAIRSGSRLGPGS